jgi:Tfp pilus assembly protein PilZ
MAESDRSHIRIKMDTRIFVEVKAATDSSEGLLLQCKVLNVSYGGFRVNIESELIVGTILSVCVELPAVEAPFFMAAEVKWCRPDEESESGWLAGFEILKSSNTDIQSWREILEHI